VLTQDLEKVIQHYANSTAYDNILFVTMLLTGFFTLLCLGVMTYLDDTSLHDPHKVTTHASIKVEGDIFQFFLLSHKADQFFEGNLVMVCGNSAIANPLSAFISYLATRDHCFPYNSALWLMSRGQVPTRAFFMCHLQCFFDKDIMGHSMHIDQGVRTKKIRYITLIFLVKAKLDLPPSPTCLKKEILPHVLIPIMDY
jgi:hypothetical protein